LGPGRPDKHPALLAVLLPKYTGNPLLHFPCLAELDQAIIYVVDSCDVDRLETSKEEFHAILEEEEVKDALILVYANKQVLSLSLADMVILFRIYRRRWATQQ